MGSLVLPMKGVYFDQIVAGAKPEEYRRATPYWRKRIEGRSFDRIILTRGYPKGTDSDRILVMPWRGYEIKTITHPHFGSEPVEVFTINVDRRRAVKEAGNG